MAPESVRMRMSMATCRLFLALTGLLLAALPGVAGDSSCGGARPDAWPVFRGDAESTGVAAVSLPEALDLVWEWKVPNGAFEATPVIAEGVVFIGDLDGNLFALDLQTGRPRWTRKFDTSFNSAGAVRGERFYVGDTDGRLHCLQVSNGETTWTFESQGEISSGPNFHEANILFGSQDGTLYCLTAETGELVWQFAIDNQIRCTPTVVANRAFVAGCDGKLHVIDITRGEGLASVDIQGPTGVTPAVAGDHVYVGTEQGTMFCINWKRPDVVWTFEDSRRRQPIRSAPAVSEGKVVFGRDRGKSTVWTPRPASCCGSTQPASASIRLR